MCGMMGVSRSGYYKYLRNKDKPNKDEAILAAILEILAEDEENENYGKVRMYDALKARGIKCCQPRVSAIMDENGLRVSKKRKPNGLTKADKAAQTSENLIKGDFTAEKPNEKIVTDITQTPTLDGTLYFDLPQNLETK